MTKVISSLPTFPEAGALRSLQREGTGVQFSFLLLSVCSLPALANCILQRERSCHENGSRSCPFHLLSDHIEDDRQINLKKNNFCCLLAHVWVEKKTNKKTRLKGLISVHYIHWEILQKSGICQNCIFIVIVNKSNGQFPNPFPYPFIL